MDIYFNTTTDELVKIFRSEGFKVTKEDNYLSATLEMPKGRFHAMFAEFGEKIYCDFHFDNKKHKYFFGVDYKKRPKDFFEKVLKKNFAEKNIRFNIKRVSWWTRRNRTISGGFRL